MDGGFPCGVLGEFELIEAGTKATTSGYAGVNWSTQMGKWLSWFLDEEGKRKPVGGGSDTAADAAIKRRDHLLKDPSWFPATVVFERLPEKKVVNCTTSHNIMDV